jgi:hypothetical protein
MAEDRFLEKATYHSALANLEVWPARCIAFDMFDNYGRRIY